MRRVAIYITVNHIDLFISPYKIEKVKTSSALDSTFIINECLCTYYFLTKLICLTSIEFKKKRSNGFCERRRIQTLPNL